MMLQVIVIFNKTYAEPISEFLNMSLPSLTVISKGRRDSACSVSSLSTEAASAVLLLPSVPLSLSQPLDISEPIQAQEVIDACRHLLRLSELGREEQVKQYLEIYSLVAKCMLVQEDKSKQLSRKIADLLFQADNLTLPRDAHLLVIIIGNLKGLMRAYL
jgi:hypothetical protein